MTDLTRTVILDGQIIDHLTAFPCPPLFHWPTFPAPCSERAVFPAEPRRSAVMQRPRTQVSNASSLGSLVDSVRRSSAFSGLFERSPDDLAVPSDLA